MAVTGPRSPAMPGRGQSRTGSRYLAIPVTGPGPVRKRATTVPAAAWPARDLYPGCSHRRCRHRVALFGTTKQPALDRHESSGGGSAIGSALRSRLLGGARLCSLLLTSDLGLWDKLQVGGVVVTILYKRGVTGSKPAVPTHKPRWGWISWAFRMDFKIA